MCSIKKSNISIRNNKSIIIIYKFTRFELCITATYIRVDIDKLGQCKICEIYIKI
jgi:hypothetical protein